MATSVFDKPSMRRHFETGGSNFSSVHKCNVYTPVSEWNVPGDWKLIVPQDDEYVPFGVWINSIPMPLETVLDLESRCCRNLVEHLHALCANWLDSDAVSQVKISTLFRLDLDESNRISLHTMIPSQTTGNDLELAILKVILNYAHQVTDLHVEAYKDVVCHMEWVPEDETSSASADSFPVINHQSITRPRIQGIIRIMRPPRIWDGNEDYLFERYIKVAIQLFFPNQDIYFIRKSNNALEDFRLTNQQPLLLAAGPSSFKKAIQARIASIARELLTRFNTQMSRDSEGGTGSTSSHWNHPIVYALHWDRQRLRILAHFIANDDLRNPQYCQAVVAQHFITLPERETVGIMPHREDDMPLDRWRIVASLLCIARYVEDLRKRLGRRSDSPDATNPASIVMLAGDKVDDLSNQTSYMSHLRKFWRAEKLCVPQGWIPSNDDTVYLGYGETSVTRQMLPSLSKLLIFPIRESLIGLEIDAIRSHSEDNEWMGPDFIHAVHAPRARFDPSPQAIKVDPTEQHLEKVYDILALATTYFREINLFLASTFSGFDVLFSNWLPFGNGKDGHRKLKVINIDFTVTQGGNQPRGYDKVPVEDFPVTLIFGLRSKDSQEKSAELTADELDEIQDIVDPALQAVRSWLQLDQEQDEHLLERASLFCTVLKQGRVIILAARLITTRTDSLRVELNVVENNLPIGMALYGTGDLLARMRLCVALFTLKRHAYQLGRMLETSRKNAKRAGSNM